MSLETGDLQATYLGQLADLAQLVAEEGEQPSSLYTDPPVLCSLQHCNLQLALAAGQKARHVWQ